MGFGADRVVLLLPAVVEFTQRLDVILFARCCRLQCARLLNFRRAAPQFRRSRPRFPHLMIFRHCHAPRRHGAVGIPCRSFPERFRGFPVGKRMQEGHATRERFLRLGCTRNSKLHGSGRSRRSVSSMLLCVRDFAIQSNNRPKAHNRTIISLPDFPKLGLLPENRWPSMAGGATIRLP